MGIIYLNITCLLKNKPFKVLSTKSGIHMMLTRAVPSTKKRPRSSFKTLLVTSDPVMSSQMKHSMRYLLPSIRMDQEPSRNPRWLSSSSNSSEAELETENDSSLRFIKE